MSGRAHLASRMALVAAPAAPVQALVATHIPAPIVAPHLILVAALVATADFGGGGGGNAGLVAASPWPPDGPARPVARAPAAAAFSGARSSTCSACRYRSRHPSSPARRLPRHDNAAAATPASMPTPAVGGGGGRASAAAAVGGAGERGGGG
ncbi:unnamed protein product [Closterium sp. Naga37s-1]|nr:unnamed protein product [Closterium sp. Naga37s-1]